MKKREILNYVLIVALIVALLTSTYYYVNLRIKNENILHTIRARALETYGAEVERIAHYLREYLETFDSDIYQEAEWALYRAKLQAEICTQGLSEDSGLIYYELSRTANTLRGYFVYGYYGPINTTKVETIAQALDVIGRTLIVGVAGAKNVDPLEYLSQSEVNEVINYCRQIQEIVG